LLQRQDVHAVIIALPILSQPQYIEAALAAGKHVLAEKPIAADVTAAKSLIDSYHAIQRNAGGSSTVTLAIAENFRFVPSFVYAREQARHLGKVTHFSVRSFSFTDTESKYYNTEWRKTPEYQGGFLLDGGVHFAAATRQYLGSESAPESVQAITHLTLPYLAPIDSVSAIVKTKTGAVGTYQHSAGTRLNAFEWDIAYEKGSIKQVGEKVTVTTSNGEKTTNEFARSSGVVEEVAAWAQGLIESRPNPFQSPEEALADLEFLEKMFKSGEQNGASQKYELQ
jgi:predicted dehydrogenase